MPLQYAVDTNILLRLFQQSHYALVDSALHRLTDHGVELCFTAQNLGEFWSASTRPLERNGFGLSIEETESRIRFVELSMTLLPDDVRVYHAWRNLLHSYQVRGVQVHDAHLAAALEVHGVRNLLTIQRRGFQAL